MTTEDWPQLEWSGPNEHGHLEVTLQGVPGWQMKAQGTTRELALGRLGGVMLHAAGGPKIYGAAEEHAAAQRRLAAQKMPNPVFVWLFKVTHETAIEFHGPGAWLVKPLLHGVQRFTEWLTGWHRNMSA
jgi:hypothetical protein